MADTCTRCGNRAVGETHDGACAWEFRQRNRVIEHAAAAGIHPATAVDLWAHLRGRADDARAAELAIKVIDLGWRPVIGANSTWLWGGGEQRG